MLMPIKLDTNKINGQLVNLKFKLDRAAESPAIEQSVNYAVEKIAQDLRKRVERKLRQKGPHKGGMYSYYRYKPYWTPAFPGEPPAQITGKLARSVYVDRSGQFIAGAGMIRKGAELRTYRTGSGNSRSVVARTYVVSVQSDVKYADIQESGSPDGRVPPRPFMRPAFEELYNDGLWMTFMEQAIVGAIKSSTGFNAIPRRSSKEGYQTGLAARDARQKGEVSRKRDIALLRSAIKEGRTATQRRTARNIALTSPMNAAERAAMRDFQSMETEF